MAGLIEKQVYWDLHLVLHLLRMEACSLLGWLEVQASQHWNEVGLLEVDRAVLH